MKKILALAGSNSAQSINQKLLEFVADTINEHQVEVLDIRTWLVPIYSENMDADEFTPEPISKLIEMIANYDAFIIASPEHNSGPTAFFKNITDWLSRRSDKVFQNKPVLLMSTSPGRRGAVSSRAYYEQNLPRLGALVASTYSLPSFHHKMVDGKLDSEEQVYLNKALAEFKATLS